MATTGKKRGTKSGETAPLKKRKSQALPKKRKRLRAAPDKPPESKRRKKAPAKPPAKAGGARSKRKDPAKKAGSKPRAPAKTAAAKRKAPAKKAVAKRKAPAKKAVAKRKAPAKTTAAKPRAPAKKVPSKRKAPTKTTAAKPRAPAKKAPSKRKAPSKTARRPPRKPPRKPPAIRQRDPGDVRDQIRRMLRGWETRIRRAFPGRPRFVTDVRVYMSRDFHISGELLLDGIEKRVSIDKLLLELGIAMHGSALNGGWLSIGFTFPPSVKVEDFELYRRLKGGLSFQTHSRRFTKALVPYIVQEARRLHEIFRKRRRYRARIVFVKIWWNPEGKRPGRRKKAKRKR